MFSAGYFKIQLLYREKGEKSTWKSIQILLSLCGQQKSQAEIKWGLHNMNAVFGLKTHLRYLKKNHLKYKRNRKSEKNFEQPANREFLIDFNKNIIFFVWTKFWFFVICCSLSFQAFVQKFFSFQDISVFYHSLKTFFCQYLG